MQQEVKRVAGVKVFNRLLIVRLPRIAAERRLSSL